MVQSKKIKGKGRHRSGGQQTEVTCVSPKTLSTMSARKMTAGLSSGETGHEERESAGSSVQKMHFDASFFLIWLTNKII